MGWTGALASLAVGGMVLFAITPETTLQMIDLYGVTGLVATANQISDLLAFKEKNDFPRIRCARCKLAEGFSPRSRAQASVGVLPQDRLPLRFDGDGIVAYADAKALAGTRALSDLSRPGRGSKCSTRAARRSRPARRAFCACAPTRSLSHGSGVWVHQSRRLWFDPGDIGMVDERGMMFVRGRSSNVLNVGGAKVLAEHVEFTAAPAERPRSGSIQHRRRVRASRKSGRLCRR